MRNTLVLCMNCEACVRVGEGNDGLCHREPPTAFVIPSGRIALNGQPQPPQIVSGRTPVKIDSEWCMKFVPNAETIALMKPQSQSSMN